MIETLAMTEEHSVVFANSDDVMKSFIQFENVLGIMAAISTDGVTMEIICTTILAYRNSVSRGGHGRF